MIDYLIYVEDPGAANYILSLPDEFQKNGISFALLANDAAVDYLNKRNVEFNQVVKDEPSRLLQELNPRRMLIGTSENRKSIGLELIEVARKKNILTIGFVDMLCNADRRFRGESENPLQYMTDILLVPDYKTKMAFIKLGATDKNILVIGHPHFDRVENWLKGLDERSKYNFRHRFYKGLSDKTKVIVFVSEGWDLLNISASVKNDEYGFVGRGDSEFRTTIILEELIDALKETSDDYYLVLRLHPKNNIEDFAHLLSEIDHVSKSEDPLEIVLSSDLVVGMTSMLLLESTILKKPTLSVLPLKSEADWLPNLASGATKCVFSRNELKECLTTDWNNLILHESNKFYLSGAKKRLVDYLSTY